MVDGHEDEEEVRSVMSSTFSLGEPTATTKNNEIDSEAEDEVVEGIKKTNLQDAPPATGRRYTAL